MQYRNTTFIYSNFKLNYIFIYKFKNVLADNQLLSITQDSCPKSKFQPHATISKKQIYIINITFLLAIEKRRKFLGKFQDLKKYLEMDSHSTSDQTHNSTRSSKRVSVGITKEA